MEQFLAPLLDMLRATPWVVWAVGLPAVIALRNRGLALAERAFAQTNTAGKSSWFC